MIKDIVKNLEISSTLRINEISKELESKGKKVFKIQIFLVFFSCVEISYSEQGRIHEPKSRAGGQGQ